MKLSEQTNELFKAFSAFQGELENASKDRQGHGYKYADLAECINTAKPFLVKHGLAVSQMLGMTTEGKQTLITMLAHSSGQYMSSEFVMVDAKLMGGAGNNPAQVLGSAITYQRRYSYAAIIGLAQEDDDAASLNGGKKQQRQQQQQQQMLNDKQCADLQSLIEEKGFSVKQACEMWQIASLSQIPAQEYSNVINSVKGWNNGK